MTKPADDKLGHAKREIKALKLKLESCSRFASQHLGKIERLESIVESCSKRNESDCDLIDSLQEQIAELEASVVVPSGVWQYYCDGGWNTGKNIFNHRENTEAAGYKIRYLWVKQEPAE
jgi:hypothetical protein